MAYVRVVAASASVLQLDGAPPMWETRWLRPRPAGSPEASLSAGSSRRLRHAPASLGQSAAWAALAGHTFHIELRVTAGFISRAGCMRSAGFMGSIGAIGSVVATPTVDRTASDSQTATSARDMPGDLRQESGRSASALLATFGGV